MPSIVSLFVRVSVVLRELFGQDSLIPVSPNVSCSVEKNSVTIVVRGLWVLLGILSGLQTLPLIFPSSHCCADEPDKTSNEVERETIDVEGWTLHINVQLKKDHPAETKKAVTLLKRQLSEIVRKLPAPAVAELKKIPLYFSPAYNNKGGAEFHPGAEWLRDNGRDPVMVKSVEFSNILNFEAELVRMPNFALHELAHGYHNIVLPDGFGNGKISKAYETAKASGKYDRVERWNGVKGRNSFEKAYGITNPMEYFAETTEAYFTRNDFFPFTSKELKAHDPEMFELLGELWGVEW